MNAFIVILFALIFLSLVFAVYFVWGMSIGAPYVPSMGKSRKQIIKFAQEYLAKNPKAQAAELGAGDCFLSFALADMGYKVNAYELNPFLTISARLIKFFTRRVNVTIYNKDIFANSYESCDLAVIYLYPHLLYRLEPILFSQMKKGSWIISNTFSFKNHKPIKFIDKVGVYQVP